MPSLSPSEVDVEAGVGEGWAGEGEVCEEIDSGSCVRLLVLICFSFPSAATLTSSACWTPSGSSWVRNVHTICKMKECKITQ